MLKTGLAALAACLLLGACASGSGSLPLPIPVVTPAAAPTIPDMTAFLVQQRCPYGALQVAEPGCTGAAPQQLGDPMLMRRHDWPGPTGYQISDAVALSPTAYASTWSYAPWGPFVQANGDGGEVYVIDGPTVRIAATQDGGVPVIQGFYGAACGGTGWITFRNDAPTGSWASLVAKLNDLPIPSACSAANPALTRYRLETVALPFLIDGQRQDITLPTVIAEHYDDTTIEDSTDMERTFFVQGVGRAIWEAWSTNPPDGQDLPARCPGTVYSVPPAPGWRLSDCRTLTNLQPADGSLSGAGFGWPPADLALP